MAGAFALCAVMVPAVTSCGDDNDEPGNGGSAVVMDGTRLTSINNALIQYDSEGRVARFGSRSDYGEIDYRNGILHLSDDDEYGDMNVRFNGAGYISQLSQDWDYEDDGERWQGSGKATFSYDGDGHLVKVNISSSESYRDYEDGESGKYTEEYTVDLSWRNGNLMTITQRGEENEDGDRERWEEVYDLTYNLQENRYLQPTISQFESILDESEYTILACAGLFGIGSELLPSKIVESDDDGYTHTTNLTFNLNANGTIASERDNYNTYIYGYSDAPDTRAAAEFPKSKKAGLFRPPRNARR